MLGGLSSKACDLEGLVNLSHGGTSLCAHCREINAKSLSAPGAYQHFLNPRDMEESAKSCPLCERFILRPEGVHHWMEHRAATGPISCSLIGPSGFKRLVLNTGTRHTGNQICKLLDIPVFTDACRYLIILHCTQISGE